MRTNTALLRNVYIGTLGLQGWNVFKDRVNYKSGGAQEGPWDKAVKRISAAYKTGAHSVWLPRADKVEQPLLRWLWGKGWGTTQIPSDSRT